MMVWHGWFVSLTLRKGVKLVCECDGEWRQPSTKSTKGAEALCGATLHCEPLRVQKEIFLLNKTFSLLTLRTTRATVCGCQDQYFSVAS